MNHYVEPQNLRAGVAQSILDAQKQMGQAAQIPPQPLGVTSMIAQAHVFFSELCQAFDELQCRVDPVTQPYAPPTGECLGDQNEISEASCVTSLRSLVGRIANKTADIYRLTEALRV